MLVPAVLVGIAIALEEALRHLTAGSHVMAAILSSRNPESEREILLAGLFVFCRLLVLWVLPALVATWFVARLTRRWGGRLERGGSLV
jgi:hypothetical protein